MHKKSAKFLLVAASVALLQGCVAAAVVGVVGGATVANDNRSLGKQIDDHTIEFTAHARLAEAEGLTKNANLQVVSVNAKVLIVGQAPNTYLKDLAIKTLNQVDGVEFIHDQIRVSNTTSLTTRSNDVWLTSKVKTALFASDNLDATNIKVVTENGEVFLMGLITAPEAAQAIEIARHVGGVNRVFKMFEIIQ
ncbi:division/outer membrane stress-associated lipid-binding lipoprotein [Thalassotalea marina]|uniref:BON domain-containing protein n=1 Tax=Thalassotalea marina TaxID=1673741 RepID=A0A919EP97_9GAMM|nr:division/outer membrane stress-associated lipid-binding lipoprotein [Thalassotalea marina]GHG04674.1 BON domain-containing protein [Thalassotalea marina]